MRSFGKAKSTGRVEAPFILEFASRAISGRLSPRVNAKESPFRNSWHFILLSMCLLFCGACVTTPSDTEDNPEILPSRNGIVVAPPSSQQPAANRPVNPPETNTIPAAASDLPPMAYLPAIDKSDESTTNSSNDSVGSLASTPSNNPTLTSRTPIQPPQSPPQRRSLLSNGWVRGLLATFLALFPVALTMYFRKDRAATIDWRGLIRFFLAAWIAIWFVLTVVGELTVDAPPPVAPTVRQH